MGLFSKKKAFTLPDFQVDVHSHLLPDIDDGVESWEDSLLIISELASWGIQKVITTPHVLSDYYPNSPETILPLLRELRARVTEANIPVVVEAAAEYYVDEKFMALLEGKEELLSFGKERFLLFETGFMNEPRFLKEAIFQMSANGYKPVMAHPERYTYFQENPSKLAEYADRVIFQVNTMSLIGYYSPLSKKIAQHLLKSGRIGFLGSDIHRPRQLAPLKEALQTRLFQKIQGQGIKNNSLA